MELNTIMQGDCLGKLKELPDNSVDSVVTDPPYELGFMGKSWDKTGIANNTKMWGEVLRVLKPGGHLLSFGGTRTYHHMACAIENAGFEIRDCIYWVYGSGFPKSLNIAKQLEAGAYHSLAKTKVKKTDVDKINGTEAQPASDWENNEYGGGNAKCSVCGKWLISGSPCQCPKSSKEYTNSDARKWEGWGTALKPAHEPIVMARKPLSEPTVAQNVLKWGTGGINVDGCRVKYTPTNLPIPQLAQGKTEIKTDNKMYGRNSFNESSTKSVIGGSLEGRFPANVIHDGSQEVLAGFPNTKSGYMSSKLHTRTSTQSPNGIYGKYNIPEEFETFGDEGSAARFFYCAKASKSERNYGLEGFKERELPRQGLVGEHNNPKHKNHHPTVKPITLMEYLVKLVTPPKGIVLDPFVGSGSTLVAAKKLGFNFIGIEKEEEYIHIAQARVGAVPATLL